MEDINNSRKLLIQDNFLLKTATALFRGVREKNQCSILISEHNVHVNSEFSVLLKLLL